MEENEKPQNSESIETNIPDTEVLDDKNIKQDDSQTELTNEPDKCIEKSKDHSLPSRSPKKKKKKKKRLHSKNKTKSPAIVTKQDVLLSSSTNDLCDDALCIRDFDVEISSFNLTKPVLLNLDTYRIEPEKSNLNDDINLLSPDLPASDLMETLEVSLDPSMFFPELHHSDNDQIVEVDDTDTDSVISVPRNVAEVSLLTSSDDDDVILQEPYVECIEVSDAGSDDEPLSKLIDVSKMTKRKLLKKGNTKRYNCKKCDFRTSNRSLYQNHLEGHDKFFHCDKCKFRCVKRKELDKHYKCHLVSLASELEGKNTVCECKTSGNLRRTRNGESVRKCKKCITAARKKTDLILKKLFSV